MSHIIHQTAPPIDVVDLLPVLDRMVLELIRSLTRDEWQAQTAAKLWKVKDVVAHLLDGNIRILSALRDGYSGDQPEIRSYSDLVAYLNGLNADWVKAMKRVSPQMLILLHEVTGPLYCAYYKSLHPFGPSPFPVSWAGEEESRNWMHIAREYTEKWLHQQQIRAATGRDGLMARELFHPFMDIFMYALPYTFRDVQAGEGTSVTVTITSDAGGSWTVVRKGGAWIPDRGLRLEHPTAEITLDPDTAWKLFSKSLRPADVADRVSIKGDGALGQIALSMVSVMA